MLLISGVVFDRMCKSWGIKHKFTTPYHPQSNITERVNRNIKAILTSYVSEKHNKWDEFLSSTALALRTAIGDSSGFSPAFLNFGRELCTPIENHLHPNPSDPDSRLHYKTELISRMSATYSLARKHIDSAQRSQRKYYNGRHKKVEFSVSDLVLRRTHDLSDKSKGICKKFCFRWEGPYIIKEVLSPVHYL
jgi:hypothetical protein